MGKQKKRASMSFNAREVDVLATALEAIKGGRRVTLDAYVLASLREKAARMRETIEKVEQSNGAADGADVARGGCVSERQ